MVGHLDLPNGAFNPPPQNRLAAFGQAQASGMEQPNMLASVARPSPAAVRMPMSAMTRQSDMQQEMLPASIVMTPRPGRYSQLPAIPTQL